MNPRHYHGLDYLRAAAALGVVFYHSPFSAPGSVFANLGRFGALGVDLFFVLSGYLISSRVFHEYRETGAFSLGNFFRRRALRIWPPYFFLIALFCFLGYGLGEPQYQLRPLVNFLTLTQNYLTHTFFSVSWSLCVEEHFYIFFALTALLLLHLRSWHRWPFVLLLLVGVELGFRSRYHVLYGEATKTSLDTFYAYFYNRSHVRLAGFCSGIGIAWFQQQSGLNFRKSAVAGIALGSVILFYVSLSGLKKIGGGTYTALPLIFDNLFISLSFGGLIVLGILLEQRFWNPLHVFVTFTARTSYSLYLVHVDGFKLCERFLGSSPGTPVFFVSLFVVYALATVLYYAIERPFHRLGTRR